MRLTSAVVLGLMLGGAALSGCTSSYTGPRGGDGGPQPNTNPGTAGQTNPRDAAGNPVGVGEDGRTMNGVAKGDAGAEGGARFE